MLAAYFLVLLPVAIPAALCSSMFFPIRGGRRIRDISYFKPWSVRRREESLGISIGQGEEADQRETIQRYPRPACETANIDSDGRRRPVWSSAAICRSALVSSRGAPPRGSPSRLGCYWAAKLPVVAAPAAGPSPLRRMGPTDRSR